MGEEEDREEEGSKRESMASDSDLGPVSSERRAEQPRHQPGVQARPEQCSQVSRDISGGLREQNMPRSQPRERWQDCYAFQLPSGFWVPTVPLSLNSASGIDSVHPRESLYLRDSLLSAAPRLLLFPEGKTKPFSSLCPLWAERSAWCKGGGA